MNYKKLGFTLKNARIAANLSQAQVSEYINKTSQNISSWERGKSKIDIDSFERLCHLYHISFSNTLKEISEDESGQYSRMSDEDAIHLYQGLDLPSKEFIKHALYILYERSDEMQDDA